jgi:hypothetical protein
LICSKIQLSFPSVLPVDSLRVAIRQAKSNKSHYSTVDFSDFSCVSGISLPAQNLPI